MLSDPNRTKVAVEPRSPKSVIIPINVRRRVNTPNASTPSVRPRIAEDTAPNRPPRAEADPSQNVFFSVAEAR
jgi:hypothetical protein